MLILTFQCRGQMRLNRNRRLKLKTFALFQCAESISAHANGGILTHPHLGLVAEDGPEAIIPLSGKRRARGLSLWEQAGKALGVEPTGTATTILQDASEGFSIENINIDVSIDGSLSPESTVDAIANNIAAKLQQAFANLPLAA